MPDVLLQQLMKGEDSVVVSKLWRITAISLVFMALELLGGYYAHSIAIFADAFHLLSDVSAYAISLYAVHKSYHQSPPHLTFGYEKVQPLGALLNVAIIWVVTAELFIEATHRIFHSAVVEEPLLMLATSVFGLLCNLYIMKVLHSDEHASAHHNCSHAHHQPELKQSIELEQDSQHEHIHLADSQEHQHDQCQHTHSQAQHQHHHNGQKHACSHDHSHSVQSTDIAQEHSECSHHHHPHPHRKNSQELPLGAQKRFSNINIEAAYIHILTDIILSIGVIVSASVVYFLAPEGHQWSYWQLADPLCTYLFSFMAIYSTLPIVRQSLLFLLDACTDPRLLPAIQHALKQHPAVQAVDTLKVWSTNRGKHYAAVRVRLNKGADVQEVRRVFQSRGVECFVDVVRGKGGAE